SDVFFNNDAVTFPDGPTNRNVTPVGTVQPSAITVNNSAGNDYTIGDSASGGVIGGTASLTKSGTGALTLAGANTFNGGATLNAGTLAINNASALGTTAGTFTINGGTIDNTTAGSLTTSNYLQTWAADFAFTGTQSLNL